MPLTTRLAPGLDEIDVIICGGGIGGCVVAGRLAEADPSLSILMIEGGQNNEYKDSIRHPILMATNLHPDMKTANFYSAKEAPAVAGRALTVQTGGVLGGGSSINFQLYSRAQGIDFDSWDMPGWSGNEIIPLMSKLETFHGPTHNSSVHGNNGPLQITRGTYTGTLSEEDFLNAASRLGYDVADDMQDPTKANFGFQRALRTVDQAGHRHDAATAYIHPLLKDDKHPNLQVLCESKVVRVLFDEDKRACGVEYTPNLHYAASSTADEGTMHTVRARKLVVLSSGALGTPLILERSGVGKPNILQQAGIPVVADVPGVGMNFDDHTLISWPYMTNLGVYDSGDALSTGRITAEDAAARGMMSWNMADVHGKLRPSEEEVTTMGPEFQKAWKRDYKNSPTRPLMMSATVASWLGPPGAAPPAAYMSLCSYTAYSYSRGYVHITGPGVDDHIDFDTGYLSDPQGLDVKMHIWQYKKLRRIMRSTEMFAGELAMGHPDFAADSAARVRTGALSRGDADIEIEYTAEDDAAIEDFLRKNIGTTWHSAGTAKMAPRAQMGVVDEKLDVYGVQGLKCVDLSIMPTMVAANTCNTAYVIGEKGAEIIMRELGLMGA